LDTIKAVVEKVILKGKHGPFAVATSSQLEGSVTFSLEPTIWKEKELPEEGTMVFLGKLRQKRAGWRAKLARFWEPSDEQAERSNQMQFLYPKAEQFPFDEVCGKIVHELAKRHWQVPGIRVGLDEYGEGDSKYRMVSKIEGRDFKLWFCRVQGSAPGGRFNDIAAVTELVIPKKELHVYEDESGPTFYLYVGNNYARDRERFMNGSKVNSKLHKEPRIYLKYKGGCDCHATAGAAFEAIGFLTATISGDKDKLARLTHTHSGRRSPLLVHDNDLGREYEPERGKWNWLKWRRESGDPVMFKTADIMAEFKQYLEENVLKKILAQPIPAEKFDILAGPEPIPFPESVGPFFCFGGYEEAKRIVKGRRDPSKLKSEDRYALSGNGHRLIHLGTRNDGTVPEIAYDGFLWCGLGDVTKETEVDSLVAYDYYGRTGKGQHLFRVKPNRANGIYIADHAQYLKRRKELGEAMEEGRDTFTDEEVADFVRARARTIVPISEYRGGYEEPIILVNRELSFDEVELVSGSHEERSNW